MHIKQSDSEEVLLSEITSSGVLTDMVKDFDITSGCAGIAFRTKEPVLEPFVQSSKVFTKQEISAYSNSLIIDNAVAVPVFSEDANCIGVFEAFNCAKSVFTIGSTRSLLMKFSRFISLLLYTNSLLKV